MIASNNNPRHEIIEVDVDNAVETGRSHGSNGNGSGSNEQTR